MRRFNVDDSLNDEESYSETYKNFKKDETEEKIFYEKLVLAATDIIDLGLDEFLGYKKFSKNFEEKIEAARMNIAARDVNNLLFIFSLILLPINVTLSIYQPTLSVASWLITVFLFYWIITYPKFQADVTRIKITDESLDLMLYLAMNLRVNPSLVRAVQRASVNTGGHLGRDLKEVLWKIQSQHGQRLLDQLSKKMESWRKYSSEFVESLEFLIDSKSQNVRKRQKMIDRGQDKMIGDVKAKMEQYARDLSSPVRVLNMVGIMLPLMGLIMFPLISVFMGGEQNVGGLTLILAVGYVIVLPTFLLFFTKRLLSRRPGAYSQPSLEHVEDLPPKDKIILNFNDSTYKLPLKLTALLIGLLIGLPGIFYYMELFLTMLTLDTTLTGSGAMGGQWEEFIESQYEIENLVPNVVQGMTLLWGLAAFIIVLTYGRSFQRIKLRQQVKNIEDKMVLTLTELQNELSKNQPIENTFYQTIQKFDRTGLQDHPLREFFSRSFRSMNERQKPFHKAVFDSKLIYNYPSPLLINSMEIVDNSIAKGPQSISKNLKSIRQYVKNKKEVERSLSELLGPVVTQMKMQAKFIAPIITAAAGSIALVIVEVLFQLSLALDNIGESLTAGSGADDFEISQNIALVQNLDQALPPTLLILITGLYMLEICVLLAYFTNGIENGFDEISRDHKIAKYTAFAIVLWSSIVLITTVFITPQIPNLISV